MKEHRLLKFLDRISGLYQWFGIDYAVFRKLMKLRLVLDSRRIPATLTAANPNKPPKENDAGASTFQYILFAFMGGISSIFLFMETSLFLRLNITFGMMLFMIGMTLISDFSSVLLDITDKSILLPRPVPSSAIAAAKYTHILYYMLKLTLCFAAIPLTVVLFKCGIPAFLLMVLMSAFMAMFLIFAASVMYFMVLLVFDGERLKDIITQVQVAMSVIIYVSYQFIGNAFDAVGATGFVFAPQWWTPLLPTTWFAAPICLLMGDHSPSMLQYSALGFVLPAVSVIIYFKGITPYFEKNLQKLTSRAGGSSRKFRLLRHLSRLVSPHPQENAFFRFTTAMVSNERTLKLRIYPSIGMAFAMPAVIIVRELHFSKTLAENIAFIQGNPLYLWGYLPICMLTPIFISVQQSDNHKGAWIYRTAPVTLTAAYKGGYKGFFIKAAFPGFTAMMAMLLVMYGHGILIDVAVMTVVLLIVTVTNYHMAVSHPPFSMPPSNPAGSDASKGIMAVMVALTVSGTAGILHWFINGHPMIKMAELAVLTALLVLIWKTKMRLSWKQAAEAR